MNETTPEIDVRPKHLMKTYVIFGILALIALLTIGFIRALNVEPKPLVENEEKQVQVPFSGRYAATAEGRWTLVRYSDEKGTTTPTAQYRFTFANNTLGTSICNAITAPYTIEDDPPEINFILLQRSKGLCAGTTMRPEDALVASLEGDLVVTLSADGNRLTLVGKDTGYRFELVR